MPDYDDDWFDDDGPDEDEDDTFDCGLMGDGQCSMAGSEWCDWECPHSLALIRARIARMKEKANG